MPRERTRTTTASVPPRKHQSKNQPAPQFAYKLVLNQWLPALFQVECFDQSKSFLGGLFTC
jgi:hypothetical protein